MHDISTADPRSAALIAAIHTGDVDQLQALLEQDPALATSRIVDGSGVKRSLLHIVADWPGHFPNGPQIAALLIEHGADVNARVGHPKQTESAETPLHWAASSDDVPLIDALLDGGADIEAPGAVFTGGTPMSDAVVFAQWNAANRLLARGATTTLWQSAALGLLDRVREHFTGDVPPTSQEVTNAFWNACRGGQQPVAEFLLSHDADVNWIGHDHKTPLEVARESSAADLVSWLRSQGAQG
jgi:uncharacterized protein